MTWMVGSRRICLFRLLEFGSLTFILLLVEAIMNVKSTYGVKKNWQGDPCGSEDDTWNGVTCKYDVNPPRVISLYSPYTASPFKFL